MIRKYYAAARIQGIIRGFLSRLVTKELRIAHRAAVKIQKIVRGIQGKKRWLAEFWRSEGVVKSDAALQVFVPPIIIFIIIIIIIIINFISVFYL